jgi:hypothetical protein
MGIIQWGREDFHIFVEVKVTIYEQKNLDI